jgi:hypothetical protein
VSSAARQSRTAQNAEGAGPRSAAGVTLEPRLKHRVELTTAVLFALAAIATAWSTYESSRWHGLQAVAQGASVAARVESTRASSLANAQLGVDNAIFAQWLSAEALGHARLAALYVRFFRGEFKLAFDAWLATKPRENPRAPATPLSMPQYRLAANGRASVLLARSETYAERVKNDIQRADDYLLAVVLFAASMFFAGISTRLETRGPRLALLGLGYVMFILAAAWVVMLPTTVAV